jgi:hypothetical protein
MKHTIRFIILFFALVMAGTGNAWAISESDIIFNIQPNSSAGTVTDVTVSGMTVTFTANPATGYNIDANHIIAEKMVDALAPRRAPGIASELEVTGSGNSFSFIIPEGYTGAYVTVNFYQDAPEGFTQITSLSEISNLSGKYQLTADVSGVSSSLLEGGEFTGTLDGGFHKIIGLSAPLFASTDGAIIRNIIFEDVNISVSGDAGAVTASAGGNTRIYNCGILPSSTERDNDGNITGFYGSSVSGSRYVGGLVGFLDGSARVINCYSYANISGGSHNGGIVGFNNVETTSANLQTMVMNCMFYGNITGGSIAPIYNGTKITNVGKNTGVSNFNYFWTGASYVKNKQINVYNCALSAETRFLQRFEFFRHLLNSNRELAAWWVKGTDGQKSDMSKWVLEPKQIGSNIPFPILKTPGYYPSVVNIDAANAEAIDENNEHRNEGRKLTGMGSNGQLAVTIDGTLKPGQSATIKLYITDKDTIHYNFNYGKVQLPYYNDYCTGNYTDNKVVTGWKITSISGGKSGSFSTGDDVSFDENGNLSATPYNFADRNCTAKDIYSNNNKRVFNQGAYWDVPEGVYAITIEPYWGKAVYLADAYSDVVYNDVMTSPYSVTTVGGGQRFENGKKYNLKTRTRDDQNGQIVYTSMSNAVTALNPSGTVYDNAVVLVGNYHQYNGINGQDKPYTVTSIDLDEDNEPDYSFILRFDSRTAFHPVRYDFLNLIGLGMAQKSSHASATGSYNLGIMQPKYWFEVTNTALFRVTQFEYSPAGRAKKPIILQGGVIEQWVTQQQDAGDAVEYFHVGGNVWFKEFHRGSHQDNIGKKTPHPPVSVTGGDFDKFYLTGMYQSQAAIYDDNAECYISGGRFGEVAGAGMEGIGTSNGKGNVTWVIDHADIKEFYGGGINAAKPIYGNIHTVIKNSHVTQFCGGPKFGNMEANRTVKTIANNCTFGTFFGAGYGGNSYNRYAPANRNNVINLPGKGKLPNNSTIRDFNSWNDWVSDEYTQDYNSTYEGVSTQIDYQFLPMSGNADNVARLFVDFVSFSLATTHNVTSSLTGCKVLGNFYGGGSLGQVDGDATSTLTNCTVNGSAFGAGFSATLPKVEVMPMQFITEPSYDENLGSFTSGVVPSKNTTPQTDTYTWAHRDETINSTDLAIDKNEHILYTNENLTNLGTVTGKATLNIEGTTTVAGSVYGGGEESGVDGNTEVKVTGGTIGTKKEDGTYLGGADYGNVYGGGKGKDDSVEAGLVKGTTTVTISGTPTIYHNVYGGGAYGSVGTVTETDATTGLPKTWNTENDKGKCTVTITGGTIGTNGKENGMVFGSSRGDVGQPGGITDKQAWVHSTQVTIGDAALETGPTIKGSVYGGGENGHTFTDAVVDIVKGTVGITDTQIDGGAAYAYRGNVYGGGCGTDTYTVKENAGTESEKTYTYFNRLAGIVRGNTEVNITGGHVVHNVYGGGAMGSVGVFTREASDNIHVPGKITGITSGGKCTVTVSGGIVGNTGAKMINETGGPDDFGHVFGGARGEVHDLADYPNLERVVYVDNTEVTISDGLVTGSVYGGSESGHVRGNTNVTVSGGQIGCGDGASSAYTTWDSSVKPTTHWTYEANGKPYDQYASETGTYDYTNFPNILEADRRSTSEGGRPTATDGHTFYGNVFGGGSGYYPYAPGYWLRSAGQVGGTATVTISGGHILNNVYGGCKMADVEGAVTVTMTGGTVGVPRTKAEIEALPTLGHIYGAGMGDKRIFFNTSTNVASTTVSVTGGTVYGSVYGGGEDGHVLGNAATTISKETGEGKEAPVIGCDGESGFDGNVFGGGQGSSTALTAGVVGGNVTLDILDGTINGSVYGGGQIGSIGTHFAMVKIPDPNDETKEIDNPNYGKMQEGDGHGCITVNLKGGSIEQNVYGGCMGSMDDVALGVSKNVTVELNNGVADDAKGCVVKGSIFGCNNVNSSPEGTVSVHIYKTQHAGKSQIANTSGDTPVTDAKTKGSYDVTAVYGGGNMAAYTPKDLTTGTTNVIIDGCGLTSIKQVYGGGNAASTPATNLTINGTFEIDEVFGGGNGKDNVVKDGVTKPNPGANVGYKDYSVYYQDGDEWKVKDADDADTKEKRLASDYQYGTGKASVNIFGGTIHRVFGGSNTKGNVRQTAVTMLEEAGGCDFCVDEAYGGGKSAPMDAEAKLLMACIPGLQAAYGGAEAADIQGNVTLNITNGTFERVFGGNNLSGTISGSITVNIEEIGCRPIVIGELYGGGNKAPYSVLGYKNTGTTTEPHYEIRTPNDNSTPVFTPNPTYSGTQFFADPQVNVKSFTSIGAIYGGGYGTKAIMVGNPTVNINEVVGTPDTYPTTGDFEETDGQSRYKGKNLTIDEGTENEHTVTLPNHVKDKIGAINNVFGGGNAAKVIGNTNVKIGTETDVNVTVNDKNITVGTTDVSNYYIRSGAGTKDDPYKYDTKATGTAVEGTTYYEKKDVIGADIRGNVYGGGNEAEVTGNTNVQIGKRND